MSRVICKEGQEPFLIVAPHGTDDVNTNIIADRMADELQGFAVINEGWRRKKEPDYENERADCNNVYHCASKPVCDEFLLPLLDYKNHIVAKHGQCFVYFIHGMSTKVQRHTQDNVHVVIGYGQGEPPSYTCDLLHKDRVVHLLQKSQLNVYQGKIGGRFSAWNRKNLCQLWRRWEEDNRVHALQLELVSGVRRLPSVAADLGLVLARVANRASWQVDGVPLGFAVNEV